MLYVMNTEQFPQSSGLGRAHTGRNPKPGRQRSRADLLRKLLDAEEFFISATTELAAETTSPTEAATLALIVELAYRRTAYAQVLVAQGAQRTLAHELPIQTMEELTAVIADPAPFMRGDTLLPEDPPVPPTGRLPHRDTADFLQHLLGISYFEARDRVKATTALLKHVDEHGIKHPARYPELSTDAQAGTIDPKHVMQAARKLDKVAPVIKKQPEAKQLSTSLQEKVRESLKTQGPQATGKLITAWQQSLEQSSPGEPTAEEISAKTGILLTRRTEHFSYFSLCMLNVEAEIFLSHFAAADNARTTAGNRDTLGRNAATGSNGAPASDGQRMEPTTAPPIPQWAANPDTPEAERPRAVYTDVGTAAGAKPAAQPGTVPAETNTVTLEDEAFGPVDGLTPARRHLQSILNALRHISGSANGATAIAKATLVVHCQLETLLGLAQRAGISAHGLEVSAGELRRLLCDAGVIPMVFNGKSQILDLGREQRFVPDYLRLAILARDGGCLVPGCTVPPEHCEICHVDSWQDGGVTSAENAGPGCSAHHHDFHSGKITLVRDVDGLPAVLLPKYLDPEQLPRRNDYWQHARQTKPTLF